MRSLPRLLLAACVSVGVALLLTLLGLALGLLPEGSGVEWNNVALSEYDLGDLAGGIVLFGLMGAVLAAIHLGRAGDDAPRWRRRLARVLVFVGLVPLVAVAAIVLLLVALCSSGACS